MLSYANSEHTASLETFYVGVALYSVCYLVISAYFVWSTLHNRYRGEKMVALSTFLLDNLSKILLLGFLLLRVAWFFLRAQQWQDDATFILSRIAFAFYFSTFTLVVFFWAERAQKRYYGQASIFVHRIGMVFWVVNFAVWSFQITVLVLFVRQGKSPEREGNMLYEANIMLDIVLTMLISFGFLIFGIRLTRQRMKSDDPNDPKLKKDTIKTMTVGTTLFACFFMRVIMYSWRLVTGKFIQGDAFVVLAYFVSELLPSGICVYLLETSKDKKQRETRFVTNLYAGEVDALDDSLTENTTLMAKSSNNLVAWTKSTSSSASSSLPTNHGHF
eukprot:TRINITY_DN5646_c0_g1_i1.p1 TRINITY_DN5646_c0_g1~~TRINITY_DN5646_c0_g1_i1.p1  ORF type:complete len:331 (-),score=33.99 TRINITY_DN5646_c0_g1_i1:106-1098(-)